MSCIYIIIAYALTLVFIYVSKHDYMCCSPIMHCHYGKIMLRPSGRTQIVMTDTRSYLPTNDEEIIAYHGKIMQILPFFRYLATGDSYTSIANSFRIGVSTTSNIIHETTSAIWNVLQPIYLPAPTEQM